MSDQVKKEQTKGAKQENITELNDEQLDEASGGVEGVQEEIFIAFTEIASAYAGDTSTESEISWTTGGYASAAGVSSEPDGPGRLPTRNPEERNI